MTQQLQRSLRGRRTASHRPRKLIGQLGDWRLVRLLGEGTFSRVYAATHRTGRDGADAAYAIKVLRRLWQEHDDVVALFRREAFVASRVEHPRVVSVLDAGLMQPPFFLVMPRLNGAPLSRQLTGGQYLPTAVALWIARQIAEGLSAILEMTGMTHGDIKPDNVLVSPDGRVTLLDLGFARSSEEHATALDRPTLCSLAYAAPETVTAALPADFRSDVFSLGAMLYQMLTGRLPFTADTPAGLIESLRTHRPACIRKLQPALPKGVGSLVHRMIAREPLRRPQSYAELKNCLVQLEVACFANR